MDASLPPDGAKFRPYPSPNHQVNTARYITSNDARGYIPVYEYLLNDQWMMMDMDDGYILWTGIWKALGNSKADIVKMVESQPDLAARIRRVRGGYLKIQGTWLPHEVAIQLSRRVAYPIRDDLIPFFGPSFPSTCLAPDQPGYGRLVPGRSRVRRSNTLGWQEARWCADSPPPLTFSGAPSHSTHKRSSSDPHRLPTLKIPSPRLSPSNSRYSPYPPASSSSTESSFPRAQMGSAGPSAASYPHSPYYREGMAYTRPNGLPQISLPPLQASATRTNRAFTLPPISSLGVGARAEAGAVLRRLKDEDDVMQGLAPINSAQSRHGASQSREYLNQGGAEHRISSHYHPEGYYSRERSSSLVFSTIGL